MSSPGRRQHLRGRAGECEALQGLLTTVRSGSCEVLVLRGEAGVGKTALLGYLTEAATGFRTVQVAGVESDMELAFAGLQQLCAPLMSHVDELPEPQREALNVAFGRGVGPTPDRFLVGLAVLSLMAAAASAQPLLCVIDDAQWLDQVSVQTLAFVARRLLAEPVCLLFAVRDRPDVLAGLADLEIEGLSDADSRELLDSVMLGGIDPLVRDRIVAETRGVPLAILEVPRSVTATELAGGFWISGKRSSAAAIEEDFVRRIQDLPADSQRLLLVAAAEPVGDTALFLRAAARLGVPVDALAPAEAAGLIEFGPRMRFHHPLMRSAAYRAADLTERRVIHGVLAEATDPRVRPRPPGLARSQCCCRARRCGGRRAGNLSEPGAEQGWRRRSGSVPGAGDRAHRGPALRGSRALAAAQAKRDAAAPAAAYEMLAIADSAPLSQLQQAQVARMRAQMELVRSRNGEQVRSRRPKPPPNCSTPQEGLDDLDDELARETYLEALTAAMYAGRLGEPGRLAEIADAARAAVNRVPELSGRSTSVEWHGKSDHRWSGCRLRSSSIRPGAVERIQAARRR